MSRIFPSFFFRLQARSMNAFATFCAVIDRTYTYPT